jgi:hypothetical protein
MEFCERPELCCRLHGMGDALGWHAVGLVDHDDDRNARGVGRLSTGAVTSTDRLRAIENQ